MMTQASVCFSEDEQRQIAAMVDDWERRARSLLANAAEVRDLAGIAAAPTGVTYLSAYRSRRRSR